MKSQWEGGMCVDSTVGEGGRVGGWSEPKEAAQSD